MKGEARKDEGWDRAVCFCNLNHNMVAASFEASPGAMDSALHCFPAITLTHSGWNQPIEATVPHMPA